MLRAMLALIIGWLMMAGTSVAQSPETAMVEKLFGAEPASAADFDPAFLAQVNIDQIRQVIDPLKALIGTPVEVEKRDADILVRSQTHQVSVQIALGADGRIAGLFVQPPQTLTGTLEEALAPAGSLAGRYGYVVIRNGEVLQAAHADERLAVGSAYKLGILKVIKDRVEAGELAWDQVFHLKAEDKAPPSSMLLAWPDGSPVTLHTLAGLMISQSDNTATDMLIDVAGREAVSKAIGGFAYKTRELFTIKADPALADRFRAADAAGKTALAEGLRGAPLPDAAAASVPLTEGIEWYLSARELCALIDAVAALDVMTINPGIQNAGAWERVAFKGGSEIGVLNLTNQLIARDGTRYCVSMTWNADRALDEMALLGLYNGVIGHLAD